MWTSFPVQPKIYMDRKTNMTEASKTSSSRGCARIAKILAISVAALFMLVVVHPWILGFPGRIQEWRFQAGLHRGMTRAKVLELANATGNESYTEDNGNVDVMGIDVATICIETGKKWIVQFDDSGRATTWNVVPNGSGC
jgi:hypothetical protein